MCCNLGIGCQLKPSKHTTHGRDLKRGTIFFVMFPFFVNVLGLGATEVGSSGLFWSLQSSCCSCLWEEECLGHTEIMQTMQKGQRHVDANGEIDIGH